MPAGPTGLFDPASKKDKYLILKRNIWLPPAIRPTSSSLDRKALAPASTGWWRHGSFRLVGVNKFDHTPKYLRRKP
jgi:hypothetical protein